MRWLLMGYVLILVLVVSATCMGLHGSLLLGDPANQVRLQVHNATDQSIQVNVQKVISMYEAPDLVVRAAEVALGPGETREVNFALGMGERGGPVSAFAAGQPVFCQEYRYRPDGNFRANHRIEITQGHLAC
jgi:hypothetical protein